MPGLSTNGVGLVATFTGGERFSADTYLPNGQSPQTEAMQLMQLAAAMSLLSNNTSKTMTAGTRYYSSITVGAANSNQTITGIQILIGNVGGTDNWIVELHDSSGTLVATSATAGALAGTAGTWQQIPFTLPYTMAPGTYFLTIQSNGNTAKYAAYNFPAPVAGTTPLLASAAVGVFGTGAAFTPPTAYTAGLGPVALPY